MRVTQRVIPNYLSIYQVRDYRNDHKAFARDVLRFEIALEGVKFLRSLEYAPPDAALTASSAPTAITTTSVAVTAITTPTLAAAVAAAPVAPVTVYTAALASASITSTATTVPPPMTVAAASVSASAATSAAATTVINSGGNNARESIERLGTPCGLSRTILLDTPCGLSCPSVATGRSTTPATSSDWVLRKTRSQLSVLDCVDTACTTACRRSPDHDVAAPAAER